MRTFIILYAYFSLFLYGSSALARADNFVNGIHCENLKSTDNNHLPPNKLCVLSSDGFEPVWYLWSGQGFPQRFETAPDSMTLVTNFMVSPSQQWLAVESVGEGHPYITVSALAPWLDKAPCKTQVEINPYPGVANLQRWQRKGQQERLIIESDRLLSEQNQDLYQSQLFEVDPVTGKIKASLPALQQPIQYYIDLLSQANQPQEEILEMLANLVKTQEQQQLFQQLAAKVSNPKVKAQLAKVLKQK